MVAVIMRLGNQVRGNQLVPFVLTARREGTPRRSHIQQPSLHPLSVLGTMDPASWEQC